MQERAKHYYLDEGKNCAVSILLAANDVYQLGLSGSEAKLFAGFGGGLQCGRTCGALSGCVAALSQRYAGRPDFKELVGGFVAAFEEAAGCGCVDCAVLTEKYKTESERCLATVLLAAQALEAYIAKVDAA